MIVLPSALQRAASRQHGVVTRAQLALAGISGAELHRWIRRGWLAKFGVHVYRMAGAPLTAGLRLHGAVLDAGPSAAISHFTAAIRLQIAATSSPRMPSRLDVSIGRGRRILRPDLVVHTSRDLIAADVMDVMGVRTTDEARTLIDCAAFVDRATLTTMVDKALARRPTTALRLRSRIDAIRRPGKAGLALLSSVLQDRPAGGIESGLERAFFDLVTRAGLPRPQTQVVVRSQGRHIARVDAVFPGGLIVELMSRRWHTSAEAVRRDSVRRRNLRLAGRDVIEFWADEVFDRPAAVLKELRRHLALAGSGRRS